MDAAAVDVIRAKRDHGELTEEQIASVIRGFAAGRVADDQMAALLMAIFLNGMSGDEIAWWTAALVDSGEKLDLSTLDRPTVDKHSTGGVGDKTSMVLAPLLAACGAAIPQLASRGLGHTGGTLDKLEAIPGWSGDLTIAQMRDQLDEVGAVICAPPDGLVPAERRLYALRDRTGTVECLPLIASSLMSKKMSEGASAVVLDIKVGSGAFIKDATSAAQLARTMVRLGTDAGLATSALLTDMSEPLGLAVGNAMEVAEAVEVLAGGGPADVVELVLALAAEMLDRVGLAADPAEALAGGAAMDRWRAMVTAQGGDVEAPLPEPAEKEIVTARAEGTMARMDAHAVGLAAARLGAGRVHEGDKVDAAAGVLCRVKPGDDVAVGTPLFEIHTERLELIPEVSSALAAAVEITPVGRPVPRRAIVLNTFRGSVERGTVSAVAKPATSSPALR